MTRTTCQEEGEQLLWQSRKYTINDNVIENPNNVVDTNPVNCQQSYRTLAQKQSSCASQLLLCRTEATRLSLDCQRSGNTKVANFSQSHLIQVICPIGLRHCKTMLSKYRKCVQIPTSIPAKAPTKTPIRPTNVPIKPTAAPIAPTNVPVLTISILPPTNTPIEPTTVAPIKATTNAPIIPTTNAPIIPTIAPITPTGVPVIPSTAAPVMIAPTLAPTIRTYNPSRSKFPIAMPSTAKPVQPSRVIQKFSGKKGVGLSLRPAGQPGSCLENLPKMLSLDVYWNYGWNYDRSACQPASSEFIPMAWNGGNSLSDLRSRIKTANIPTYISQNIIHFMLGYNEPDLAGQANMNVSVAIQRWTALQELGIPLISPSAGKASGDWMLQFMGNATSLNLRVDYLGVHAYGGVSFASFVNRLKIFYQLYGLPIVVTEFACPDWSATTLANNKNTPSKVLAFMKQALPWMEQTEWIIGYAWFPYSITSLEGWTSALFDEQGNLTTVGRYYKSVRSDNVWGDQSIV